MVWRGEPGQVERESVVEGRSLAPETQDRKHSQVMDLVEKELVEPLVEELSLGEDLGWDP